MGLVPINLTTKTNPSRYKQGGAAQLLNCYVERTGEEGKTEWAIYPIEGLKQWGRAVGYTAGIRAMLTVDDRIFFVAGKDFFKVDTTGTVTWVGVASDFDLTSPVYMERNRRTLPDIAVVNNGNLYYYRETNTNGVITAQFTKLVSNQLKAPYSLAFVDGYFVIGSSDNYWQIGTIDDVATWDLLDAERGDANPDKVVRVSAYQRDAVIFGEESTEFWRNTGAADFPFERVATNEYGCLSPDSALMTMQGLTWVAHDRTVRVLNGYDAQKISTHAVDRDIQSVEDFDTISATTWTWAGHSFYALSSPNWTWVYDSAEGLWHTRRSTINGENQKNWRITKVVEYNNKIIAGDRNKPYLYTMDGFSYEEDTDPIKMIVTLPPVTAFPKYLTFHAFYLDMEKGIGLGSEGNPEDQDPEVILRWSKDGGYTFDAERKLKLGKQGQRSQRIKTFRLGRSKPDGYVFQIEAPTRTIRALYQCYADVEAQ